MPKFMKITFSSSRNITVQGDDYTELSEDDFDDNGEVHESVRTQIWQDAVNEFMADTCVEVVDNEGD